MFTHVHKAATAIAVPSTGRQEWRYWQILRMTPLRQLGCCLPRLPQNIQMVFLVGCQLNVVVLSTLLCCTGNMPHIHHYHNSRKCTGQNLMVQHLSAEAQALKMVEQTWCRTWPLGDLEADVVGAGDLVDLMPKHLGQPLYAGGDAQWFPELFPSSFIKITIYHAV